MGEYLNHLILGEVKIGTCENLYYTTFQQFVNATEKGYFKKSEAAEYLEPESFRFRFPFPDEKINIGEHQDYGRGVVFKVPNTLRIEIGHTTEFHRVENPNGALGFRLPCIQSAEFPVEKFDWSHTKDFTIFEIDQQKLIKSEDGEGLLLATIVRCPYCGNKCRLDWQEMEALHIYADTNPRQFTDLQMEIIKIAREGYTVRPYPKRVI